LRRITSNIVFVVFLLAAFVFLAEAYPIMGIEKSPSASFAVSDSQAEGKAASYSQDKAKTAVVPKETTSVTKHSIVLQGKRIDYTATAGTMLLKTEEAKAKGSIFYIAYTKDGVKDPSQRPIMFCFNGGPGGAAVWVHLGAFGPKKSLLDDEGFPIVPPPGKLIDNEFCALDLADLVFIDPMSTGYSRPAPGEDAKQFYGFEKDVESVAEFIRLYVTRNERWLSPKFLAGESYATTRVSGLANYLQSRYGMFLNGVILISVILNWQNTDWSIGNDMAYIIFLPSYTAAAWYHGKLGQELSGDLRSALDKAEDFAINEFALALLKGNKLKPAKKAEIIKKLSKLTGLSEEFLERSNMRVTDSRFYKELLRDQGKTVGRLDTRYTGVDRESAGEAPEFDHSWSIAIGSYVSLINDYIRRDLKYENDLPYNYLARVQPWPLEPGGRGYLNTAEILRQAMHMNPQLKVLIASGYYDFATPYFDADYTVAHLDLAEELQKNITTAYYESGHMMYVRKTSHQKFRKDMEDFIQKALAK
jgi:carboxypeptidase C (cathepsin A)